MIKYVRVTWDLCWVVANLLLNKGIHIILYDVINNIEICKTAYYNITENINI